MRQFAHIFKKGLFFFLTDKEQRRRNGEERKGEEEEEEKREAEKGDYIPGFLSSRLNGTSSVRTEI